jgi:hypothetical protein
MVMTILFVHLSVQKNKSNFFMLLLFCVVNCNSVMHISKFVLLLLLLFFYMFINILQFTMSIASFLFIKC